MEMPPDDRPPEGVNGHGLTRAAGAPPHSRYCHRCQFNGRTDATAARACMACPGAPEEMPHHGLAFVSLDAPATPDAGGGAGGILRVIPRCRAARVPDDATVTAGELRRIFCALAEFDRETVLIMHGLLTGKNLSGACRYAGIDRRKGHDRAKRALARLPLLAAMYPFCPRRSHGQPKTKESKGDDETGNATGGSATGARTENHGDA